MFHELNLRGLQDRIRQLPEASAEFQNSAFPLLVKRLRTAFSSMPRKADPFLCSGNALFRSELFSPVVCSPLRNQFGPLAMILPIPPCRFSRNGNRSVHSSTQTIPAAPQTGKPETTVVEAHVLPEAFRACRPWPLSSKPSGQHVSERPGDREKRGQRTATWLAWCQRGCSPSSLVVRSGLSKEETLQAETHVL